MKKFFECVYELVKKIPCGKVTTYGIIAKTLGHPKASKYVGYALHANSKFGEIPCHRVVDRNGKLSASFVFGGKEIQKNLLEREGVEVSKDFKVDLERFLFDEF